ncbi:MAG: peptidase C14, partial [Sphingobacteriales bacterium]
MKRSLLSLLFCLIGAFSIAQPTKPLLRMEAGTHMAKGNRISTDLEGRILLTASDDKTARLWDASSGRLLKTFRIPIADGDEGKLYAAALSPNGKMAAVGGWTGSAWDGKHAIYIFEVQTGVLVARIKNFPDVILDLHFSPDGRWLAAGLAASHGVAICNTSSWTEQERLSGFGGDAVNLAFNREGNLLAATSENGHVFVFENFKAVKDLSNFPGEPNSVAFSHDGENLAIGFYDHPAVEVRQARTGRTLYKYDNADLSQSVGFRALTFDASGRLWAGGSFVKPNPNGNDKQVCFLRRWERQKSEPTDFQFFLDRVRDILQLPNGSLAVFTGYPEIAVLDREGALVWRHDAPTQDFTASDRSHFRLNFDGSQFGVKAYREAAISVDLRARKTEERESLFPGYSSKNGGTTIDNWSDYSSAKFNTLLLSSLISKGERTRSVDVAADGTALVGSSWWLRCFDKNAKVLWRIEVLAAPWCLKIAGNGKVFAAAHVDGIIRWYRLSDGKELLAYYLSPDKQRWIAYTPSGYYDASAGAEDLLGWHVNNGADAAPDFFPVSRYRETYYRPDVIDAILETYDEPQAIALANSRSTRKVQATTAAAEVREKRPPVVTILSPATGSTVRSESVRIEYSFSTPEEAPVKSVKVLVNGRPVALERGVNKSNSSKNNVTVTIPSTGESTITLLAESDNGISPEANLFLRYEAPPKQSEAYMRKPKLYVLAIGISAYQNADYKLNFADKDADAFVNTMVKQ